MCPEQATDMGRVDARCERYSLGIVLFEMLAGTPKVRPDAFDADLSMTSPEVRAVVRRATQPKESDRFQSATEFAGELNRLLGGAVSTLMPAVSAPDEDLRSRVGVALSPVLGFSLAIGVLVAGYPLVVVGVDLTS